MLFLSGEEATGLFVIIDGKVRAFQHNAEGREHVMHVDTAGAVMAEVPIFDDGPYPASAMAEEDTNALFIGKRDMCQFCLDHPSFMFKALKLMAARVRRHAQMVEILSFHEVGQRLALLLLAQAQLAGAPASGADIISAFLIEPSDRHSNRLCPGRRLTRTYTTPTRWTDRHRRADYHHPGHSRTQALFEITRSCSFRRRRIEGFRTRRDASPHSQPSGFCITDDHSLVILAVLAWQSQRQWKIVVSRLEHVVQGISLGHFEIASQRIIGSPSYHSNGRSAKRTRLSVR